MTLFRPECIVCKKTTASIEVVPPDEVPVHFADWSKEAQQYFHRQRQANQFYLIYSGPGGSNGSGDPIEPEQAKGILSAFAQPKTNIREADLHDNAGFCIECSEFYCPTHWDISSTGYGTCPKGHGASLDPHWSPDYDFD